MKTQTKFNIDDKVYIIRYSKEKTEKICQACKGKGTVKLDDNNKYECPNCYERGIIVDYQDTSWFVSNRTNPYKIGFVRVSLSNIYKFKNKKNKMVEYMCFETGIGSGTVYYEEDCFLTLAKAEKECENRNRKRMRKNFNSKKEQ